MDRRRFVGAFAGSLVIARSVAETQPAKVYRIGFFLGATGESVASLFGALSEGQRDLGYVEGRNVVFGLAMPQSLLLRAEEVTT